MKIILPADSRLHTSDRLELVGRLAAGAEIATPNGMSRVRTLRRCLPPSQSVVFDIDSLFPGGPTARLQLGTDALVGFRHGECNADMAAAAGLVNGGSIRRGAWPRRTEAVMLEVERPIALEGVWVGAPSHNIILDRLVWAGPSIMRWRWGTSDPSSPEFDRIGDESFSEQIAPVRLMSDGCWTRQLSSDRIGEDFLVRFAVPAGARWIRIVSPALRPSGQTDNDADFRRFGIAIVDVTVDGAAIALDCAALISGFYPVEGALPRQWRWTNGDGLVTLKPTSAQQIFSVRFTNWHQMLEF